MMKKIITSVAVAAALSTVAFAAGTFTGDSVGMTFNKNYMSDIQKDVNRSIADINYTTTAAVTKDSKITITLNGDASFQGDASDWKIEVNNAANGEATGLSFSDSATKKELKLQVTEDINDTAKTYKLTYKNSDPYLTLAKTAADDVKVSLAAETFVGGSTEKIDGASFADTILFDAVDNNIEIKVGSCTKQTVNKDRDAFKDDGNATCNLEYKAYTMADVDYNLTDANLTVTVSGMDFADGNITSFKDMNEVSADAGSQVFTVSELNTTRDLEGIFELEDDAADLITTTLKVSADVFYASSTLAVDDVNKTVSKVLDNEDFIAWELTTYTATVLNMRSNGSTVDTFLKVYNDTDAQTAVSVTTTSNGVTNTQSDVMTIDANSAKTLTATTLKANDATLANGFKAVVTMEIDSDKGDMVAFQNDATNGKVGVSVVDNNPNNDGN